MQITSISFFRFHGWSDKLWALAQMQLSKRSLAKVPQVQFAKLLGSGTGEGFDLSPNWSIYSILATWPSLDAARAGVSQGSVYQRYLHRCSEHWSVLLSTTRCKGEWDGHTPFEAVEEAPASGPIGVLTRATVDRSKVRAFWRSVPPVSADTAGQGGLHFKLGVGELPVVQLMTFSIWSDRARLEQFAYQAGAHREAMQKARQEGWFTESLFARFRVIESLGTWRGEDPLCPARIAS